jgi:hypothetical protein
MGTKDYPTGERHPQAKLTEAEVREIHWLAKPLTQRELGTLFGVTGRQISDILAGKKWKHIYDEFYPKQQGHPRGYTQTPEHVVKRV